MPSLPIMIDINLAIDLSSYILFLGVNLKSNYPLFPQSFDKSASCFVDVVTYPGKINLTLQFFKRQTGYLEY
jgi:hypothetical protein